MFFFVGFEVVGFNQIEGRPNGDPDADGSRVGIDDGRLDTLGAWEAMAQYSRALSIAFSSVMP